jgi:hypothetical protein
MNANDVCKIGGNAFAKCVLNYRIPVHSQVCRKKSYFLEVSVVVSVISLLGPLLWLSALSLAYGSK